MTGISRRHLLTWLAASPWLLNSPLTSARRPDQFASASRGKDGQYYLNLFDSNGQLLLAHPLPGRAHQVIRHPTQPWLLAIARRPGEFIDVLDFTTHSLVGRIHSQPGQRFYGHGQITADGKYLLTTEQSDHQESGIIVVRTLTPPFRVVQHYDSGGIGPHEIRLSADQRTLVVANGGIATRGREKLNLDQMQPSLCYLQAGSGQLIDQVSLPADWHQCSIRHIDLSRQGEVLIAMQYQGHPADEVPLVAWHRLGQPIAMLPISEPLRLQLKQYCGSACFDGTGRFAAVSAPRGNQVLFWDIPHQRLLGSVNLKDACGLAATTTPGEFLISTGRGRLYHCQIEPNATNPIHTQPLASHPQWQWDNHLLRL